LTFSPDSQHLASGTADKNVRVWNLLNPNDTQVLSEGHDGAVLSLEFSTDGERIASVSMVNSIRILIWKWHQRSGKPYRIELPLPPALPENCEESLTLSPDLNRLACGGSDGRVLVWDLQTPSRRPEALTGSRTRVSSLTFSPDSSQLASAGNFSISIWDLRKPMASPKFFPGRGAGDAVAFSPDSLHMTSGYAIWDLRNPALPPEMLNPNQIAIKSLRYALDGRHLAAFGGTDGGIRILNVWLGLADYLCTRVSRNLSMAEWQQYVGPNVPYERTCPSLPSAQQARGIRE
jgi:WD40 repeat protein